MKPIPEVIPNILTVGTLREILSDLPEDLPIHLSVKNASGYETGFVRVGACQIRQVDEEGFVVPRDREESEPGDNVEVFSLLSWA